MGLRVELFADIRRDARVEGLSIDGLAGYYRVSRNRVRQALANTVPRRRTLAVSAAQFGASQVATWRLSQNGYII
jgi:hypothetical protein